MRISSKTAGKLSGKRIKRFAAVLLCLALMTAILPASGAGTGHFLFPVRPHRCDHLQLRLSGQGEMRLLSISRILETGSDYR